MHKKWWVAANNSFPALILGGLREQQVFSRYLPAYCEQVLNPRPRCDLQRKAVASPSPAEDS